MGTTILSFQNRVVIETLHNEGRSLRYIANYLGFSKTTIFNEVLSPVKLTLIKTKTQFFLSDQIVVIFRHGLVISFSGNELIREVHYSSTNLFL